MTAESPEPQPPERPPKTQADQLVYRAEELLQGRREIWIEHSGEMYRLRITAAGKLYLTK